jgi:hypothetical protein
MTRHALRGLVFVAGCAAGDCLTRRHSSAFRSTERPPTPSTSRSMDSRAPTSPGACARKSCAHGSRRSLPPRAFHVVDPVGRFVTGFPSEYMLRRSANGRDTVALFGRDWSATAVPLDEKRRITEQRIAEVVSNSAGDIAESTIRAAFDPTDIPEARPAFEGIWLDGSGRTWVRLGESDTTRVFFDLRRRGALVRQVVGAGVGLAEIPLDSGRPGEERNRRSAPRGATAVR